ncbi:MAG: TraB/GumN family protein [Parachlamydiaceae bacterium]|nr:MAG: TraB/GumN family protein [Parachlamydiaceae bacterium]
MKFVGMTENFGLEHCIFKVIKNMPDEKEFIGLENSEMHDPNLDLKDYTEERILNTMCKIRIKYKLSSMLRSTLSGTEDHILHSKNSELNERNHSMVERSISSLEKERTFIAVGAEHLVGEEGMINLYRAKGYTIIPKI